MAMPFWPATDFDRVVDLFEIVEAASTPPSTNYARLYDPATTFDPPAASTDPANPAMFATWGFERDEPVETFDPNAAGSRSIVIAVSIWVQRDNVYATPGGKARLLGAEFFRELQGASVSGLTFVPQAMRWSDAGRPDPDFMESRMTIEIHST